MLRFRRLGRLRRPARAAGATAVLSLALVVVAAPPASAARFRNLNSGHCMSVSWSTRDGGPIMQWGCSVTNDRQQWRFFYRGRNTRTGNSVYIIQNAYSGRCLDVPHSSRVVGRKLIEWTCHYGRNQLWEADLRDHYEGAPWTWRYINVNSGLCLDVTNGSRSLGASLQQWHCNGTLAQWFYR